MKRKSLPPADDRITYRELRNTPGQVWDRLDADEPLTLVADGRPRALLIPVTDGDVRGAYEAYIRGRALLAASRIRKQVGAAAKRPRTLAEINALIAATRRARRKA